MYRHTLDTHTDSITVYTHRQHVQTYTLHTLLNSRDTVHTQYNYINFQTQFSCVFNFSCKFEASAPKLQEKLTLKAECLIECLLI